MRYFKINSDDERLEIEEHEINLAYLDRQMREMEAVQDEEKKGGKLSKHEKQELKRIAGEKAGYVFDENTLSNEDRVLLGLPVIPEVQS